MADKKVLINRLEDIDIPTLDAMIRLGNLINRFPGINNPESKKYSSYPDELKEIYKEYGAIIPKEYDDYLLFQFSCGEWDECN